MILIIFYNIIFNAIVCWALSNFMLNRSKELKIGKKAYGERIKLHRRNIPRLGGVAIYGTFCISLLLLWLFERKYFCGYTSELAGIVIASVVIFLSGLYDDIVKRLNFNIKFLFQIIAVIGMIISGYSIEVISSPFGGEIKIGFLGPLLILLWMLTIMNAINLIDGLDGLASGISFIVLFGFFIRALYQHDNLTLLLTGSIIGAIIPFLIRYNFYPAKLFLGDSGSIFLGFIIGIIAMQTSIKRATAISLTVPLLILFVPIGSVTFTFLRRIIFAKNPFKADTLHLHYRLLRAGISHRDTVLLFYTVTLIYTAVGMLCSFMPKRFELSIITIAVVGIILCYIWAIHFINIRRKLKKHAPIKKL